MTIKQTIRNGINRGLEHAWLVLIPAALCFFVAATWATTAPDQYQATEVLAMRMTRPADSLIRSAVVASARDMMKSIQERMLSYENLHEVAVELEPFPEHAKDIERVVRSLRRRIKVRVNGRSGTVVVSMSMSEGPDPAEMCRNVVSSLVEKYTTHQSSIVTNEGASLEAFLSKNASFYRKELENKEAILENFRRENAGQLPDDENENRQLINAGKQRVRELTERKELNRLSRQTKESDLQRLRRLLKRANEDFEGDEEINNMRKYVLGLQQELIRARGIHTKDSDEIKRIEGQIDRTEKAIATLIEDKKDNDSDKQNGVIEWYESQVKTNQENLVLLNERDKLSDIAIKQAESDIETARQNIIACKKNAARYKNLKREVDDAKEWRMLLFKKFQDAQFQMRFQKSEDASPLKSISPARKSTIPIGPKRLETSLLGLFAGLGIGVALAFLKERFDGTVRKGSDLRLLLPGAVVVTLPDIQTTGVRISHWLRNLVFASIVMLLIAVGLAGLGIRMEWWGDVSMIQPLLDRIPAL